MHTLLTSLLALLVLVPGGGWLGVQLGDQKQAVVTEVIPGSPAKEAGLQAGDVIVAVDKTKTATRDELIAAIRDASPGDTVKLLIDRQGQSMIFAVKLGARPDEVAIDETAPPSGVRIMRPGRPGKPAGEGAVGPQGRGAKAVGKDHADAEAGDAYLGIGITQSESGVVIDRILDDAPVAKSGLRAGDKLIRVGKHDIGSLADLDAALGGMRVGKPIEFKVFRGDSTIQTMVVPGARGKPGAAATKGRTEAEKVEAEEMEEEGEVEEEVVVAEPKVHTGRMRVRAPAEKSAEQQVEQQIASLRAELAELRKQLTELRKQLRRERR
ncbi:MAG: PDZ domain-containing protein [Planctomycetes bacterium]|nr:PDZ domain-containing protein [Planctomycetota bacterium]